MMKQRSGDIDLASIFAARERIAAIIMRTPLLCSASLSSIVNGEVYLKLENEQLTGSFKIRGAANAIRSHIHHGGIRGVTTASTGNHARAVAYIGRQYQLAVRAYMSRDVSRDRIASLRAEGATVNNAARDQNEAIQRAYDYATEHQYAFIPPFDDPAVISGQGTLGLELIEALPTLDTVVIPISGGGLASGIALAIKNLRATTRVIGVCAENAPAMNASLEAGYPVTVPERNTVAESLRGDLGPDNHHTFRLVRQYVDEIALVSEDDIINAQRRLRNDHQLDVEGAAAAATAYLETNATALVNLTSVVLITGRGRNYPGLHGRPRVRAQDSTGPRWRVRG